MTLAELTAQLFVQCGWRETQARRKCMEMFDVLAPLLLPGGRGEGSRGGAEAAASWVSQFLQGNKAFIASTCRLVVADAESNVVLSDSGSSCRPGGGVRSLVALAEGPSIGSEFPVSAGASSGPAEDRLDLFDWLSSALDVYAWLVRRRYVSVQELVRVPAVDDEAGDGARPGKRGRQSEALRIPSGIPSRAPSTRCLAALVDFIRDAAALPSAALLSSSSSPANDGAVLLRRLRRARALVVCRAFSFITIALHAGAHADLRAAGVIGRDLHRLVFLAVSAPRAVDLEDEESATAAAGTQGTSAGSFVVSAATSLLQQLLDQGGADRDAFVADITELLAERPDASPSALPLLLRKGASAEGTAKAPALSFASVAPLVSAARLLFDGGIFSSVASGGSSDYSQFKRARLGARDIESLLSDAAEFASDLGNAVFCLPDALSPEQTSAAVSCLDLALHMGWRWEADVAARGSLQGDSNLPLSARLLCGQDTSETPSDIDRVRAFFNRFSPRLAAHLLSPAVFMPPGEATSPVLCAIVQSLSRCAASERKAAMHMALEAEVRKLTRSRRAILWQILCSLHDGACGGGAAPSTSEPRSSLGRVPATTFIAALIDGISDMGSWVEDAQQGTHILQFIAVLRWLASHDPWLLVAAPSESPLEPGGAQISRAPRRSLPTAVHELVERVLTLCASPPVSSIPAADPTEPSAHDLLVAFLGFLPLVLPGFSAVTRLSATLVDPAALLLLPVAPTAAATPSSRRPKQLNGVYRAALRCVRVVVYQRFPVRSADLLRAGTPPGALEEYRSALSVLLAAVVSSGSPALIRLLHRELRQGRAHVDYAGLVGCLRALAEAVPPDGESPVAVLTECLATCFCPAVTDHDVVGALAASDAAPIPIVTDGAVLRLLCEQLAVPLLQRLRRSALRAMYESPASLSAIVVHARELFRAAGGRGDPPPLQYWAMPGVLRAADGAVWAPTSLLHFLVNIISVADPFTETKPDPLRCLRYAMVSQLIACLFDALSREEATGLAQAYASGRPPR